MSFPIEKKSLEIKKESPEPICYKMYVIHTPRHIIIKYAK